MGELEMEMAISLAQTMSGTTALAGAAEIGQAETAEMTIVEVAPSMVMTDELEAA